MTRLLFLILLCQVFNMKKMIFLAACGILLKLMSIELVMPSNHLMLCHPLLLLPLIFPSIRVYSNDSATFTSGGQATGVSVKPGMLQSKGLQRVRHD